MAPDESFDPAVAALLEDPATHGLPADARVLRIDTHAAAVFLAGDRAYKVKRRVRYPFLDYSTLALREAACRAEIDANRPFAADLYCGVVPISRGPGGRLSLGGPGDPVEWAVEMARFDEAATLDRLAERAGIPDALARDLAAAVALGHARAPVVEAGDWLGALVGFLDDDRDAFRAAPELFAPDAAARLDTLSRATLSRIAALILARGRLGLVRRCHGDLHLGNVALIDGRPVPFDAIEFDPLVAAGDVLYDLAFLLMDLVARGLPRAANIVLNRYLGAAGRDDDFDALVALPFYLSLRAQIRAKVAASRSRLVAGAARAEAQSDARRYFALALALIEPEAARLVAVGGLSGTGKSALAAGLAAGIAPRPGTIHLRSDVERKRLAGVTETDRLPADAYTQEATARVYARLCDLARRALAAGHSVVVDAVFAKPGERAAIENVARACEAGFAGLWLEAPVSVRVARVDSRTGDASDADADVARRQEGYDPGRIDWHRVDASGEAAATLARATALL